MTMSGTLTAAGYMWCMVEKAGTAPAKKTGRLLSNATNATNTTTKANTTANTTKTTTTPAVPD